MRPYISKSTRISQSSHHEHMFIVDFPDGRFYAIHSSEAAMRRVHPEDNSKFNREVGQFNHTSNYKPQSVGFQSFQKLARSHAKQSKS